MKRADRDSKVKICADRKDLQWRLVRHVYGVGSTIFLILGVVNFLQGNVLLSVIEFILGAFAVLIVLDILKLQIELAAALSSILGTLMSVVVMFNGGADRSGLVWVAVFPAVSYFIKGPKYGLFSFLTLFFAALVYSLLGCLGHLTCVFSPVQIGIALFASATTSYIGYLNESVRRKDAMDIAQAMADLTKARFEADKAAGAKGEFLAHMSHELRTPLNGVIGMISVLRQSELKKEQQDTVDVVQNSANILLSLINNILDFSSIESGHMEISQANFNLRHMLEDVCRIIAPPAQDKGLEIILDYSPDLPVEVVGDEKHLRQVFINLMGNAVKFTHSGHVMASVSASSFEGNSCLIDFNVCDTGIGIPEDQLESIFCNFNKSTLTSKNFEGTGLGLTISDRLVELMGGQISVSSEQGRGTCFSFSLDLEVGKSTASESKNLQGKRLLVVDYYPQLTSVLTGAINRLHGEVVVCKINDVVSHLKNSEPYDFVLLDAATIEESLLLGVSIKESLGAQSPPIHLFRKTSSVVSVEQLDSAGIAGTIIKPIVTDDFVTRLLGIEESSNSEDTCSLYLDRPMSVLLVDDNAVNRKVTGHFLKSFGCVFDIAVNGLDALGAAKAKRYDMIFMDCQMPVMDGYEATREIRKHEQAVGSVSVPIIALTANAMSSDSDKCLDAGMDGYLMKPLEPKKLEAILSRYALRDLFV